jgi:hypothetical protein
VDSLLENQNQQTRQYFIEELIKSGIYKKNNKHLYEWTLSDLKKEYKSMEGLNKQRGKRTTRSTVSSSVFAGEDKRNA